MQKYKLFMFIVCVVITTFLFTACGNKDNVESTKSDINGSITSEDTVNVTKADILGVWYEIGEYDENQMDCYKTDYFSDEYPDRFTFNEDDTYFAEEADYDGNYEKDPSFYGKYSFVDDKFLLEYETRHMTEHFRLEMRGDYLYKLNTNDDVGYIFSRNQQEGIKNLKNETQNGIQKMKDNNYLGVWYEIASFSNYGESNEAVSHRLDNNVAAKRIYSYEFDDSGYVTIKNAVQDEKEEYVFRDNMLQVGLTTHYELIEKNGFIYLLEYDYDIGIIKPSNKGIILARNIDDRVK